MPPLEGSLRNFISPVQKICIDLGRWGERIFAFPLSLFNMTKNNRELTKRVAELNGQVRVLEEYRLENERLKKLLDFKTSVVDKTYVEVVNAAIIGRDPDNWFGTLTLGKGSNQGIGINMVVIVPEGLVGRVIRTSENTAQVLLVTDPRSSVSGLIQQTRSPGLVEGLDGNVGELRMAHIPYDKPVSPGQVVITSGMGSFFPKGIPIGEITATQREPSGLYNNAGVRPYVDFNRLEEVIIIRKTS